MLTAEDLGLLPDAIFSLIVLRSTLHHILDVPAFLDACSKKLSEGGLLMFEEPCHDGYLLMGAMNQFLPTVLRSKGIELDAASLESVRMMTAFMQFYARRDLDKSHAEDKHLFRPDELMRIAAECGMELEMFPNRTYSQLDQNAEPCSPDYFFAFYSEYLQYSMSWDEKLVALVREHMSEYFTYFHPLASGNALPYCYGSFILKKTDSRPLSI
jgi:2-polyprenyl-3-methyl-5-hydroxy-6-metoxy-1,4-benzoquinol methylase